MPAATDRREEAATDLRTERNSLAGAILSVALLAVIGISGSVFFGFRMAESTKADWTERSRNETVDLSAAVDSALLQVEVQLRALAALFYSSDLVEARELAQAEDRLPSGGLGVTLSGLAYAVVVDGQDRSMYEDREGVRLAFPGRPDLAAPASFTHFPIVLASRRHPIFTHGSDLAAHPALRSMALSAERLGQTVVMSPAFRMEEDWLIGFAIAVPNGADNGILFGLMSLDHLLEHTVRWKSDGLILRLQQYPSSWEEGTGPFLVHGPQSSREGAAVTHDYRFTHGEARWALLWDVLPSYKGGVDLMPAVLLASAGGLLSLLVGLAVGLLVYQNALIRRRVDLRTAELQAALTQAEQASRAKTNFLAVVGHELRTPLNAVIGFSDLLEPVQTTPASQDYIRFVQSGGRHLLRLVNALLEVARAEQGALVLEEEDVDPAALIRAAVAAAESSGMDSTVTIDVRVAEGLPSIRCDRERLELVVVNLLLNAVRAAGAGESVTIEARVRDDGGVRLTVSDTGPGMTETQVTGSLRLFEQAEGALSRRHEGLGIGLPLCRHLVKLHGGTLSVDTEPGHGTTVIVDLGPERSLGGVEPVLRSRAP